MSKSFVIRVAVYSLALLLLAGDLLWLHGPLYRFLIRRDPTTPESLAAAKARGEVARVFHHPILVGQLERAVADRLRREGRPPADLEPGQLKLVRLAALNELIDHQLLRVKTQANAVEVPVGEAEIEAEFERFAQRFASPQERAAALAAEGIASDTELRYRLAARLQQEKYIESRIGPAAVVSEAEARQWYDEHRSRFVRPERLRARHLFVATLERDPAAAEQIAAGALARLQGGQSDFAALAAELSEDERTKPSGGELGWFSRERLPADFTAAVFALPASKPSLVRSKLGWHLVEVLDRRAAEPIPFEQAREELVAALESERRRRALDRFRAELRHLEARHIHIFREVFDALQSP